MKYKEIEFYPGCTIEQAVHELWDCKSKGLMVYGEFNGHKLYSDTVTMDGAYEEVTGKNKCEFDKNMKQWKEDYKIKSQNAKDIAIKNIPTWIEKGHKILSSDKWNLWDEIVPIRAKDLYNGLELDWLLEIESILKTKTTSCFKDAISTINNQGHSGMSYGLIKCMIKEFCTNGDEFVKLL